MKVEMLPELTCQSGGFASFVTCPVTTYKSGNVVQTDGANSVRSSRRDEGHLQTRIQLSEDGGDVDESPSRQRLSKRAGFGR